MFAGGTVLFNFFQAFDNLFEKVPYGAVDSFAVLFKKIIERNRDFQHLQLFDFLFVFTDFGGDLKLYFCSIGQSVVGCCFSKSQCSSATDMPILRTYGGGHG